MKKCILMIIVLCSALAVLTGCNKKIAFVVDEKMMQEQKIFTTSQEPRFSLKVLDGLNYLGSQDYSENDVDLKHDTKIYRFVSNGSDNYSVLIEMTTVEVAEWGMDYPWTIHLEKKNHGSKTFRCGIGTFPKKGHVKSTYKAWQYVPGGIGLSGSTRVIVYYFENGDYRDDPAAFSARADARTKFKME